MSKAAITPRADSIVQSRGMPGARSATQPTSAPDSTFGMRSPSTDPAIASRSRAHVSLRALLTRTKPGREAAPSATIGRARSFMSGGTASSRSSSTTSAPASNTRRKSFSLCPGAKSQLRGERVTPPPARLGNVFTDELARDHCPEDVVGALADRHERRIPIEALDLIFGRIAVAAVDAHRLERCFDADLRRFGAFVAQLVEVVADREARRSLLDHQNAHAPMTGLGARVGLDEHRQRVRVPRVRDPGLGPVHDVVIAIAPRDGRDALQVAARLRLGQRDA